MIFQSFDEDYIRRLTRGDPDTESHFAAYFGELIYLKLRSRLRSRQLIEDVRQETLLRVLQTLRKRNGIEHPERFGAFVNAVCNNVQMELCRAESRHDPLETTTAEPADSTIDLEAPLVRRELKEMVHRVLRELPHKDQELLRCYFLEEEDKAEVCRRFGVKPDYLRVLLHRARLRFRKMYEQEAKSSFERRHTESA